MPDIPTLWKKMEKIQEDGLAKYATPSSALTCADIVHRSIGVSNFNVKELQTLLASAKIKPVANQVCRRRD